MPDVIATLQKPLVPVADPHTFRLGLVLNGTVAAGAWTAGVLDALTEALDTWEQAKADGLDVPRHTVRIDVMGGASGGGVCAAIMARAASRRFAAVQSDAGDPANPFWQVWVETLDIAAMLDTDDLPAGAPAKSLLDGKAIQLGADTILNWGGGLPMVKRRWLADPFHVAVTLTNLRGVPYGIQFEPGADGMPRSSWYVDHADHALFAFPSAPGPQGALIRPDEFRVDSDFTAASAAWTGFGDYVKATGAFPVGFPPLRLSRPTAQYGWRAAMVPEQPRPGGPTATPRLLQPAWTALPAADQPGATYSFDCVDGGACNNQPVELVRQALAGLGNTLERDGKRANAAVLLIDPFAAAPECAAPGPAPDLFAVATGLAGAWKDQARFATSDLLLALDPTVFSRFLLTAGRTDSAGTKIWGGDALSGAGLGAFLGFLDRRYRVHDYMLGRKNCRDWLRSYFTLDDTNPVFAGFGQTPAAGDYRPKPGVLPIIPLVAPLRGDLPQPVWPVFDPATDALQGSIETRLRTVAERIGAQSGIPCDGLLARLAGQWGAKYARKAIEAAVQAQSKRA